MSKKNEPNEVLTCAFWTETQVATRLNMSVKWLQKMRLTGGGIPYRKFGSQVRYAVEDVTAFEAASARGSTSEHVLAVAKAGGGE